MSDTPDDRRIIDVSLAATYNQSTGSSEQALGQVTDKTSAPSRDSSIPQQADSLKADGPLYHSKSEALIDSTINKDEANANESTESKELTQQSQVTDPTNENQTGHDIQDYSSNSNENQLTATEKTQGNDPTEQKLTHLSESKMNNSTSSYSVSTTTMTNTSSSDHISSDILHDDLDHLPQPVQNNPRRVKVYRLNSKSQWDDRGTGNVTIKGLDTSEPEILVLSETDPDVVLLQSPVQLEEVYQKQQESLIVWNEPGPQGRDGDELALSFQEPAGCKEILELIGEVQSRLSVPFRNGGHRLGGIGMTSYGYDDLFCRSDDEDGESDTYIHLPPTDHPKHLDSIVRIMIDYFPPSERGKLVNAILKEDYIEQLCALFRMSEDIQDITSLRKLFSIFKIMIMLSNHKLIDKLFAPEHIVEVMGALEYDPELARKPKHRDYLSKQASFNEVVPIPASIAALIHKSFRIAYVKDVVLPRILDEPAYGFLSMVIDHINGKIAGEIRKHPTILPNLFAKMKNPDTSSQQLTDCLLFLSELCDLIRSLENPVKSSYYEVLDGLGLFEVLERTISSSDAKTRLTTAEILYSSVDVNPGRLRKYILKQAEQSSTDNLLTNIIHQFHTDSDTAVINAQCDLLRCLLDLETADENGSSKTEFITYFYAHHMTQLCHPIMTHKEDCETRQLSDQESVVRTDLLDILSFVTMQHGTKAKQYIINNRVLLDTNPLLKYNDKHIALAELKFIRLIINLKDEDLCKMIVKDNILELVVKFFLQNQEKYNLVNSACLDLFSQLTKDVPTCLISYFVHKFYDQVKHITYTESFRTIKEQYDKLKSLGDGSESMQSTPLLSNATLGRSLSRQAENDRFRRELDEMAYFEDDDDVLDTFQLSPSGSRSLSPVTTPPQQSYLSDFNQSVDQFNQAPFSGFGTDSVAKPSSGKSSLSSSTSNSSSGIQTPSVNAPDVKQTDTSQAHETHPRPHVAQSKASNASIPADAADVELPSNVNKKRPHPDHDDEDVDHSLPLAKRKKLEENESASTPIHPTSSESTPSPPPP